MGTRTLASGLAGLALAPLVGLAACHAEPPPPASTEPVVEGNTVTLPGDPPKADPIGRESVRSSPGASLRLHGRIAWDEDLTTRVYSPFEGRVTRIGAEPGQRVEAGAVLATLASPDYGQAEADARKSESELRLAERNLARLKDLFEHGAAPRKELDAAEADFQRAQSEQQRATARLTAYGGQGLSVDGSFALRSPIAGIVVDRNLYPGQEIRPDQILASTPQLAAPLFVVTNPAHLWVLLDVGEQDAPFVAVGERFEVHPYLTDTPPLVGRVVHVADFLDPATRTVQVRGEIDNPAGLLRAEMLVAVDLVAHGGPRVNEVPAKAVLLRGERHFVFVETAPRRFERREVRVGRERDGWIEVTDGVDANQRVVTDGVVLLEEIYSQRTPS